MNAIRTAARVAARLPCQLRTATATVAATRQRSATSGLGLRLSTPQQKTAFSTLPPCRAKGGEVNSELIAKIESELQIEKQMRNEEEVSSDIKAFLDDGPFEIHDTPGREEVVLSSTHGEEKYATPKTFWYTALTEPGSR
jgi:complement component 1 Q subcomponent-binding protein